MSDPKTNKLPPQPAETARQEGAQGTVGQPSANKPGDGAVDASDPEMAPTTNDEIAQVADQVHANA